MLSTLVKFQLIGFLAVALVGMGLLGTRYLGIPERFGVGSYDVTLEMTGASGLYSGAPVRYRGVQIGTVGRTELTPEGVDVVLNLRNEHTVPSSVRVEVRNGSVIGEPYVALLPDQEEPSTVVLASGDTIDRSRVSSPVSTATMLTEVQALLGSIPGDALSITLEESAAALGGQSEALQDIIDAGGQLTDAALEAQESTLRLIDNSERVLSTQVELQEQISRWAVNLETVTGVLESADSDLRTILTAGAPTAEVATDVILGLQEPLPAIAEDLAHLGEVLHVYQPALRHLLIVLPGLLEANGSAQKYYADQNYGESGLSFKLAVNDPPICQEGFPDAGRMRSPQDLRQAPLPPNSYCKVASSDPRVVRGARNMPCPNDPDRRGARAVDCGLIFNPEEIDE